MKSLIKTITTLLLSAAVLCAFASCDSEKTAENSEGMDSNVLESSESADVDASELSGNTDEEKSGLLLYKIYTNPGTEYAFTKTYDYTDFGEISVITTLTMESETVVEKYEYDDNRKLISITTTDSKEELFTEKVEYEYNDLGLLVKETKIHYGVGGVSEYIYSYDENNRLVSFYIIGGMQSTYTYHEDGGYTIDTVLAGGTTGQEIYDKNGRLIEENADNGSTMLYSYNENGDILSMEGYNYFGELTQKETYTYDEQVTIKRLYRYDELISTVKYYYDGQSNLIKITRVDDWGNETVAEEREYKVFDTVK